MSFVSPVPNAKFSALGNHGASTETTLARKIGLSFLALSVDECEFHILVMTVFTLAGFQYFGAALEGTSRRPLALGCSASRTPAQSTGVLHRPGRTSSGSPENCGEHVPACGGTSRRALALGCSASRTPAQSTGVLHRRGRTSSGSPENCGE